VFGFGVVVSDDFVVLGRVSGIFGAQGWVKVHSETRERADILRYNPWHLRVAGGWQAHRLLEGRVQGSGVVVARLEGIRDRDQVRGLIGVDIAVRREQLPPVAAGEYYWSDLEGLRVVNGAGIELGTVSHLFEVHGANDVLVVKDGEHERLIPFTRDAVKQVDLESRVIRVDWDAEF